MMKIEILTDGSIAIHKPDFRSDQTNAVATLFEHFAPHGTVMTWTRDSLIISSVALPPVNGEPFYTEMDGERLVTFLTHSLTFLRDTYNEGLQENTRIAEEIAKRQKKHEIGEVPWQNCSDAVRHARLVRR